MKRLIPKFLFFIFLLISTSSSIYAQSLIEKLGGVKTDFIFTSNSTDIKVIDQAIILRGFSNYNIQTNSSNSYGHAYGFGLQTFYLEFITTSELKIFEKFKKKASRAIYDIKLYDKNDTLILNFGVLYSKSKPSIKTSGITSYSINLIQIPLIIFDRVKTIDVTLIVE